MRSGSPACRPNSPERLSPPQAAREPPSLQLLQRRLQDTIEESRQFALHRKHGAANKESFAHRENERSGPDPLLPRAPSQDAASPGQREAPAARANVAPIPQSSPLDFDVIYTRARRQCRLAIRPGPGLHLSAMFVSRDLDVAGGPARVTRVALRPELSDRPENLANQILRALFAQGDPLQHAPVRSERRLLAAHLLRWAARYQALRAHAPQHEPRRIPPPAAP